MIGRCLGVCRLKYSLGACRLKYSFAGEADVSKLQSISRMPFYISFKEGLNLTLAKEFEKANQHFQQALTIINQNTQDSIDNYIFIQKKIVLNNLHLHRYTMAEQNLYSIIKYKKNHGVSDLLIYDDYNNLFLHFLRYNPTKAVLLGKALLTESQKYQMGMQHQKLFQFNLGNAYFLMGNYQDAKQKYSQCLENQPQKELKIHCYNNLGLACWWHKNPLIASSLVGQSQSSAEKIDKDYKQSKQLFAKAIEVSENVKQLPDLERKYGIQQILSGEALNSNVELLNIDTLKPMYNLAQYYIHNEPNEKVYIMFWLQMTLKLAKLHRKQQMLDEILVTLSLLNNEKAKLLENIPQLQVKYSSRIESIFYLRIASFLTDKQEERTDLAVKITKLEKQLTEKDQNCFKRKYLAEYELKLS